MKTPYLYFGRKGFIAQEANTNGVCDALTIGSGAMLPINKDNATLPPSLRVLHKAGGAASSVRGALLTTAGSAGNASVDFVDGSTLTANHVSGEVTNLSSLVKTWTITGSDEIVRILTICYNLINIGL